MKLVQEQTQKTLRGKLKVGWCLELGVDLFIAQDERWGPGGFSGGFQIFFVSFLD